MGTKLGVGAIGVGILGSRHARVYQEQDATRLVAIAHSDQRKSNELGIKLHVRGFNDHRVMMVNPGPTNTTIWDKKLVPLSKEVRDAMMHPEDVAEVVGYLASLPERVRIDEIVGLPNQFPVKLWDYRVE